MTISTPSTLNPCFSLNINTLLKQSLKNKTMMESLTHNYQFLKLMKEYRQISSDYHKELGGNNFVPISVSLDGEDSLIAYRSPYCGMENDILFEYLFSDRGLLERECYRGDLKEFIEIEITD